MSEESDGGIVTRGSYVHDVADDRSIEVVGRAPGAPYYGEIMPMHMDWVLPTIYDVSK